MMASNEGAREEYVLIGDALVFIKARSGFVFERRQFLRYCEAGVVQIGGAWLELQSVQIGERWYITRRSIDAIVRMITSASRV
jgi:hypothetical protein